MAFGAAGGDEKVYGKIIRIHMRMGGAVAIGTRFVGHGCEWLLVASATIVLKKMMGRRQFARIPKFVRQQPGQCQRAITLGVQPGLQAFLPGLIAILAIHAE